MNKLKSLKEKIINWFKHFGWFIKESTSFLSCNYIQVIMQDGLIKAFKHANFMTKWDSMTPEQREQWYLTENRVITID